MKFCFWRAGLLVLMFFIFFVGSYPVLAGCEGGFYDCRSLTQVNCDPYAYGGVCEWDRTRDQCVGSGSCRVLDSRADACSALGCTWVDPNDPAVPAQVEEDIPIGEGCCYGGDECSIYFSQDSCKTAGCLWNPLCSGDTAFEQLVGILVKLISWVPFGGIAIGVAFLMIGGISHITAGDNVSKATESRSTVVWAIIGIVLSACLWLLTRLLVDFIPGLDKYIKLN